MSAETETDPQGASLGSFTIGVINTLVLLLAVLAVGARIAGVITNYAMVVTIALLIILYAAMLVASLYQAYRSGGGE